MMPFSCYRLIREVLADGISIAVSWKFLGTISAPSAASALATLAKDHPLMSRGLLAVEPAKH